MGVTTATLWVCSNCGHVDRLDGHAGSNQFSRYCPQVVPSEAYGTMGVDPPPAREHSFKPVVVVVPYA